MNLKAGNIFFTENDFSFRISRLNREIKEHGYPTDRFTIFESQIPSFSELFHDGKRRSTDSEGLELQKARSGRQREKS